MNWVSVKERLPEEDKEILALDNKETIFLLYYFKAKNDAISRYHPGSQGNGFYYESDNCCGMYEKIDVTHWIYAHEVPRPKEKLENNCEHCSAMEGFKKEWEHYEKAGQRLKDKS